jgi:hypothetical protein
MGRTLPTATDNVYHEKQEWRAFRNALDKADRPVFDRMFDSCKLHTMAMMASMPAHPVRIQLILMSIIFEHYKQLEAISAAFTS